MSFQAYLDTIKGKPGLTPRRLVDQARERSLDAPGAKAGEIVTWLREDYDLGGGHAMALVHVIQNGTTISEKHVGTDGTQQGDSTELWLEGKATRPGSATPGRDGRRA